MMGFLMNLLRLAALGLICYGAYNIRLHAVENYGRVIHEFDPYFNLRATEYLVENGWNKFINWYDDRTWYPLGRPVGTTIYPGLQLTAWGVFNLLGFLDKSFPELDVAMSINDVCVYVPAWFSIVTCLSIFGFTYEVTRSANAGVAAAFFMSVMPAHLMRSVAGGYDNESIAMGAMCTTFFLWTRSLRCEKSWPLGFLTALSYAYMVFAWGGYVFVLNMIGVHAGFLLVIGRFTPQLHHAYSLFYIFGTLGAIQLPVVGLAPLKSLEQLGPMFVFFLLQLAYIFHLRKVAYKDESLKNFRVFQMKVLGVFATGIAIAVGYLAPRGYFGPLSSRVRGLFIQHTRTGNPLVDSVAEHQATRDEMYFQFFECACYFGPIGLLGMFWNRNDAKMFLLVYSLIAMYFSRKMNRLVLLLSPAASALAGLAFASLFDWSFAQFGMLVTYLTTVPEEPAAATEAVSTPPTPSSESKKKDASKKKDGGKKKEAAAAATPGQAFTPLVELQNTAIKYYDKIKPVRVVAAGLILFVLFQRSLSYWGHSTRMAEMLSNPSIILKANTQDGRTVTLDDFREAYWWLRDHTPLDARVMSWWDYGYQISQIANRTTLADGNTWNHEHIALLGKMLVSPVKESHDIMRHLADYVLVWSTRFVGNPGDDIAKSPHMARIGGSVFKDIKANDFYIDRQGRPSKMMYESLVYNLVLNKFDPNVPPLPDGTYKEVYTSSNRMVRIYKVLNISKKSKRYCAENRGYKAWYAGEPLLQAYPPALNKYFKTRQDFQQLEDFNVKKKAKN